MPGEAPLGHTVASESAEETEKETENASDLRIEILEFRWTRQRGGNQQALARFQNKKKERAVIRLGVAKLRGPQRTRNSSRSHRKRSLRRDVCGVAAKIRGDSLHYPSQ